MIKKFKINTLYRFISSNRFKQDQKYNIYPIQSYTLYFITFFLNVYGHHIHYYMYKSNQQINTRYK